MSFFNKTKKEKLYFIQFLEPVIHQELKVVRGDKGRKIEERRVKF